MTTLRIDIETYSDINIGKLGVYKYVDSPNFRILLFAYAIDDDPVEVIDLEHNEKIPKIIEDMLFDGDILKTAFNAQFERICLDKYYKRKTVNWECTMIKAWECGINGGLASVGDAIGLSEEEQKMKEGKRLIRKFCTPNKSKYVQIEMDNTDWKTFIEYCRRDVEVERKIGKKLDKFPIPDFEKELYKLDQEINDNGIKLDLDMVENAIRIDEELSERATKRYKELTGLDNPNSLTDIKTFIKRKTGISVKSITKGNMKELKEQFKDHRDVLEVLYIRTLLSKTSTAKFKMMKDIALSDGRSRGNIQFYGATRTGRWAGRLIQVHNLPQNHVKDLETARHIVKYGDLDLLQMTYGNAPDILSQCIRPCIIPEDGKKFMVADFSAIEARVVAWLAGEEWVLDVFRGDGKIYEAAASRMFNVPVSGVTKENGLRQKGKVATLALGYQGGPGALAAMGALKMGIKEDELQDIVDKWREANSKIVSLWYETQKAAMEVIRKGSYRSVAEGRIKLFMHSGILWVELPSGRRLAYCKPRLEPHEVFKGDKIVYQERDSSGKNWIDRDTYGGRLVENIVQATARDCLAYSMLSLKKHDYKMVMHVHDEVIIEIDKDSKDLDKACEIMGEEIPWAPGLPLRADGYECNFYMKD